MFKVNLTKKILKIYTQSKKYGSKSESLYWNATRTRQTFVDYFKSKDHLFVPSSSVIPKKNDGSYFVNSGMNQFKPIFLGTVDQSSEMASYKRVVNYQKCIRVGGKHNDLDDVGHDYYHHTFFEMLGNWSFSDYTKEEACKMAWDLLTNVYKIPKSRLYITYFGGLEEMGLKADEECRDVWMSLGVPKNRIIPFGMKDNFWVMGETGPCGPCSEIHFYHGDGKIWDGDDVDNDYVGLVNRGVEEMKEIWNLVFMQYDRQPDGTLLNLPSTHIDTGMGLERLTALLQSKTSNYDTDLFKIIFDRIATVANVNKYGGNLVSKTDVAYRIIADHMRMCTICIGDGLVPGRKESEGKLRQVIYRCLYQAHEILGMPHYALHSLVPAVVQSLELAYPYLRSSCDQIQDVINDTENRYLSSVSTGRKMMKKALIHFQCSIGHKLSGDQILRIQEGYFGKAVSYDIISLLAPEFNVSLDDGDYERLISNINNAHHHHHPPPPQPQNPQPPTFNQQDITKLKEMGVQPTEDSNKYIYTVDERRQYNYPSVTSRILAMKVDGCFKDAVTKGTKDVGIIFDRTCFYATAGGQEADSGSLIVNNNPSKIKNAVNHGGYVVHWVDEVNEDLNVGRDALVQICKDRRTNSSSNHTSTHILNFSLRQALNGRGGGGGLIKQHGSLVRDDLLTFDFVSLKTNISADDLKEVNRIANDIVARDLVVHRQLVPLEGVQNLPFVVRLDDEAYPKMVYIVSIGSSLDEILHPSSSSSTLSSSSSSLPLPSSSLPASSSPTSSSSTLSSSSSPSSSSLSSSPASLSSQQPSTSPSSSSSSPSSSLLSSSLLSFPASSFSSSASSSASAASSAAASSSSSSPSNDMRLLCSVELCGGTHIDRTGDIGQIVITNFEGSIQGTKRITAVTRHVAKKALQNAVDMENKLHLITSTEDINEKLLILKDLDRMLSSGLLLPKIERENILEEIKSLNFELSQHKNKLTTFRVKQKLLKKLKENDENDVECIVCTFPIIRTRELVECLVDIKPNKPAMILSDTPNPNYVAIVYVPQSYPHFDSKTWATHICRQYGGQCSAPKGKMSKHSNITLLSVPCKSEKDLNSDALIERAHEFLSKRLETEKDWAE